MSESFKFVYKEHKENIYKIFRLAKYDVIARHRDAYLGVLWFLISPIIQIFTYWFAFGLAMRQGKPVDGIPYLNWLLPAVIAWFFISSSITKGAGAINNKAVIIKRMKFPSSIIPTIEVIGLFFDHICILAILLVLFIFQGYNFNLSNLMLVYYIICSVVFCISLSMVTSVLTMIARDFQKLITSLIRMIMYMTPILWTINNLPGKYKFIMNLNPIFYITEGYRNSFYNVDAFWTNIEFTIFFWVFNILLIFVGSKLQYRLRDKFADLA